jgi:CBS domain-containing protein
MQRRPPVTTPDATLRSAARQMASEHTGLLPVIAGGRLVGTLSAFDLAARTVGGNLDADRRTVRAVMRPLSAHSQATCRPEERVGAVRERMRRLRQPALPVIEANGELVGLVDLFDLDAAEDAGSAAGPEPEMARRVRGEPH